MTLVSLHGLSKTYPGAAKPALAPFLLDIASGECTALLGPSGCGKTTALKMIAGLLSPTAGDITFDGVSVLQDSPDRRSAVMVFQNHLLFPYMSVAENIGFGLKMRGLPRAEIAERVDQMLLRVQMAGLGDRKPAALSGGQQQRVALARALILRPKVLLLDEPLSNLDANLRIEMRDLIRDLQKDLRITTIFVTHDQQEAVVLADRIALLLNGTLRQTGPAECFFNRPADAEVARFFGSPNFISGLSQGGMFESALGPLSLPDGARNGPGLLTFRPESLRLGGESENAFSAVLMDRLYLGTQTRLRFAVEDVVVEGVFPPDLVHSLQIGAQIRLTLARSSLWVLAT